MNPNDELLSAYLDGEVTPVERERMERALAESPALRAELRLLRQTSQAVAGLPRVSLPASFAGDVVRALDSHPTSVTPVGKAGWTRAWRKYAVAAGVAACVLVALRLSTNGPQPVEVARNGGPDAIVEPAPAPVELPSVNHNPVNHNSVNSRSTVAVTETSDKMGGPKGSPTTTLTVAKLPGTKDYKALVGRIVEAYDPAGVAVVKVYVVDYDETWQRLQVVLEKSSFVDTDEKRDAVRAGAGGEMVAVLTGAPTERLEQALAALSKEESVLGLDVDPEPLLVAQLDEKFRSGFAVASAEPVARTPIRLPGRGAGGTGAPVTRSVGGGSPLPAPSPSSGGSAVADAIRKGTAWSKTVVIPSTVLGHTTSAATADKANGAMDRSPTEPVQVLFVLEKAD